MDSLTTSWVRKMVCAFMAMVFINYIASTVIEISHYRNRQDSLILFMRHAADYTRVNLQTISSTGFTGNTESLNRDKLQHWASLVESQARSNGSYTPWLKESLNKITSTAGRMDMFTPLNFGLTYLDQVSYQNMFERALKDLVSYNYGTDTSPPEFGTEWGTLRIDDVRVTVSDPIVKNLAADNLLLQSIFGNSAVNTGEFLYVISYDVKIEVYWSSITTTPAYRVEAFPNNYSGPISVLQDQVIWKSDQPIVLETSYVLTN